MKNKKYFWITLILNYLFIVPLSAQDLIILRDATEIESKVYEITDTKVFYKKWENQNGPSYVLEKDKILYIKYQNGSKDIFEDVTKTDNIKETTLLEKQDNLTTSRISENTSSDSIKLSFAEMRPLIRSPRFQGYLGVRMKFGLDFEFGLDYSLGIRIYDYAYLGFNSGFTFALWEWHDPCINIPIGLNIKGYFPINARVHPFIEVNNAAKFSYIIPVDFEIGYDLHLGLGFDIGHFSISFGWNKDYTFYSNNFYLKIQGSIFRSR